MVAGVVGDLIEEAGDAATMDVFSVGGGGRSK